MRNVQITVFPIARTCVDRVAVHRWLHWLTVNEFAIPEPDAVTDPALLIAIAAKRCYMSFEPGLNPNVTKVRRNLTAYLDNILKSGHGSVLEHSTWTFAIEGVSRVFTGEMNRHRAGVAISEGSMRYIRFNDIPWWRPPSISFHASDSDATRAKKTATSEVFARHFIETERRYAELQEIWKDELAPESNFHAKKQITSMMRRIIPMGVATGGVWTLNIRALRHVVALRASAEAEEEICHVASLIAKTMANAEPMLFGDFSETPEGYWVPKYRKV